MKYLFCFLILFFSFNINAQELKNLDFVQNPNCLKNIDWLFINSPSQTIPQNVNNSTKIKSISTWLIDTNKLTKLWQGVGWFFYDFKVNEASANKAYFIEVYHAGKIKIYINNKMVFENNSRILDFSPSEHISRYNFTFIPNKDSIYHFAIRYENYQQKFFNFHTLPAGFFLSIHNIIYSLEKRNQFESFNIYGKNILSTISLSFSLLYLALFFYNKKNKSLYHFSMFSLTFAFSFYFGSQQALTLNLFNNILFMVILRTFIILHTYYTITFVYYTFDKTTPRYFKYIVISLAIIAIPSIVKPYSILAYLALLIFNILLQIEMFRVTIRAAKRKEPEIWLPLSGLICMLVFSIYDLIITNAIPYNDSIYYANGFIYGTISLFIFMSIYLARDFATKSKYEALANEQMKEMAQLKHETLNAQFNSLKNQVDPHFLFNTLNALIGVIEENKEKGIEFVEKLSDVYRFILQNKEKTLIDLASELEFLEAYTFLLKSRYDNNFEVIINIPEETKELQVIPFSLQLLVENATKHNIITKEQPLTITIDYLPDKLIVSNNIQKKNSALIKSSQLGLKNIQERYRFLGKDDVCIKTENNCFIVEIPII